jgi:uncharacterized protein
MRFVCDVMLGKLAKYMRIFGMDTVYARTGAEFEQNMAPDQGVGPYLFTRRLRVRPCDRIVLIRSDRPKDQLREVWHIISPYVDTGNVMSRCIGCNAALVDVSRADIEQYVPEYIFHRYKSFKQCPACRKVYWEGSHALHMSQFIEEVALGSSTQ